CVFRTVTQTHCLCPISGIVSHGRKSEPMHMSLMPPRHNQLLHLVHLNSQCFYPTNLWRKPPLQLCQFLSKLVEGILAQVSLADSKQEVLTGPSWCHVQSSSVPRS